MDPSAATQQFADTLTKEGSLWFESAFCKGLRCGALLFSDPVEVILLYSLSDLERFFLTLEEKRAAKYFLAGWLSYEVGYGFEPTLFSVDPATVSSSPLAWFGVYREPEHYSEKSVEELFSEHPSAAPGMASFNLSSEEYQAKIRAIKEQIAAGNVYQVNFTGRNRFNFSGTASALFCAMRGAQPASYTAFLNTGERTILSFSPELFFTKRGMALETMPMKGTAPRGSSVEEDTLLKEGLTQCQKNRAENLMIVDLLRNDLGRICRPGSIVAEKLFATETYPTLHQMVSTIRGEQREKIGLYELFKAIYPSGSVTGAPKIKAMKLIQTLETEPRAIYTGTIGFIMPDGDMVFNVAIRTVEMSAGKGVYGSGSGIVWDSDPQDEYQECRLKAKILADASTLKVCYGPEVIFGLSLILTVLHHQPGSWDIPLITMQPA
jgi:para-aminobenzoate synthetase / 4-amino-4-deoxychorismate lyase